MGASRAGSAGRLGVFVAERFPPLAYGPLIAAFVACGTTAAAVATGVRPQPGAWLAAIALVVAAAFLQLRILDEIRDADVDRAGRPGRPVPRGLVTIAELRVFAVATGLVGAIVAALLGPTVVVSYGLAVGTIWLLGTARSGQPGEAASLHTALTHSVIAPLLLACVWAAVAELQPEPALAAALLLVWGASLSLELSRKTVLPDEERPSVPTYSAELGRQRALLLSALALVAALVGAAGLALAVGALLPFVVVPAGAAVLILLAVATVGPHIPTRALHAAATGLVLSALLWPFVLLVGPE